MSKRCRKCGEDKPLSDFPKEKRSSDGVTAQCKHCTKAKSLAWYKSKGTQYHRTQRYRISPEEYTELLEEQLHRCACCGSPNPKRKAGFVIDHDHASGIVRGLLCHSCNIGIGLLGDTIKGLELALDYLRCSNDRT
jgi:hypothetical protein